MAFSTKSRGTMNFNQVNLMKILGDIYEIAAQSAPFMVLKYDKVLETDKF